MPFEPQFPDEFSNLFHGHIQAQATDPHGVPNSSIISMEQDWHLSVNWQVHGALVPAIGGTWHLRAYVESIGPGPEMEVASADIALDGGNNYSRTFAIGPNVPGRAGAYKLVSVLTYTDILGNPGLFAAYDEAGILQFYEGRRVPS